jgi:hypothetical protein
MVTKSKIAVIAAIAAFSLASPAFAQSFDSSWGTGNELPSYYDQSGGLHAGIAPHSQTVAHRSGLNAFASIGRAGFAADAPSNTGGGSVGATREQAASSGTGIAAYDRDGGIVSSQWR